MDAGSSRERAGPRVILDWLGVSVAAEEGTPNIPQPPVQACGRRLPGQDSDIDVLYTLRPGRRLGWEIEHLTDELTDCSAAGWHPCTKTSP
jgi:hypothetical protein